MEYNMIPLAKIYLKSSFIFWVLLILPKCSFMVESALIQYATQCEYFNTTCTDKDVCMNIEVCPISEQKYNCYVVWSIGANGISNVSLKGCFLKNGDCEDQNKCVETSPSPKNNVLFCCCEENMCNSEFFWKPKPIEATPPSTAAPVHKAPMYNLYYYVSIGIVVVLACTLGAIYYWRRKNKHYFNGLPTSEPHPLAPSTPIMDNRPITLNEIKARGRFGAVWKAQFKGEDVAVKIFPIQDKQSWITEQDIFKLPHMSHSNILHYIGVEKRGDNLQAEFWLITAYHEKGSLCDFLKSSVLTWVELCRIAETMSKGLMRLHEAIPGVPSKPAIAHRDFKSKNVLLKSDLTACIADFGLAITFEAGKSCGDTHGQVGTRRYMAPEILEGAISFTQDSFLRIDMYACGLVLWELVSRCTAQGGPISEYRLPFEEEVGQHPSLEDMQESVVQQKVRPLIHEHWRHHPGLAIICETIEECWDHDAEARLSASCVMERIIAQAKYQQQTIGWRIENEAPLNTLKENSM